MVTKTLLAFQQVNVGTALAMSYSDGTVDLRDRATLELLPRDGNDRISSLAQVGFSFPARGPGASSSSSSPSLQSRALQ